jgi:uncharacterized protein (DUF924 family)
MTIEFAPPPPANSRATEVLDFWFGPPGHPERGKSRACWFMKSDAFDAEVARRFAPLVAEARAGGLAGWEADPHTALALLIVCDQFPRNLFRNHPDAFALDTRALALAREMVERGWDRRLTPLERSFVYLPFEHSESLADQEQSLLLFGALRDDPDAGSSHEWAVKHHEVIRRFGRFPHRNAALGRESTSAEVEFLSQPGSRF